MKVGDFVCISFINIFGFIERVPTIEFKSYKIKSPVHQAPFYFYDKHLVLIYEN